MIKIGVDYLVNGSTGYLEEDIQVPNNFFKWNEEKQDEYLNSPKVINQIAAYTSKMDSDEFENGDHIIHDVMISLTYK